MKLATGFACLSRSLIENPRVKNSTNAKGGNPGKECLLCAVQSKGCFEINS